MSQVQKIPKLRFPGFEGEWEERKLGEIFTFIQTNSFSRSLLNYESGEVKNIHYGDIHMKFKTSFDILKEDVPFINNEVELKKIPQECYCQEGDLIIADASEDYNDIGKSIEIIKLYNQKLLAGLHTYIARDSKNITVLGIKGYIMQTHGVRLQVMTFASGISVLGISKGNLAKIELHLPTLPEQQKIAHFLTAIDEKINQLSRQKALLEQYKKGVMQQIFSRELRFRDGEGRAFGEWEVRRLGEVCEFKYGKDQKGVICQDGKYPILGTGGEIGRTNAFLYDKPSVLIGRKGTIDKPRYMDTPFWTVDTLFYTHVFEISNPKFLFYQFETIDWYTYNEASGVPSLSASTISKISIQLPTLPEQQKIADFLTALDEKISRVAGQVESVKGYKKGLLQGMFV